MNAPLKNNSLSAANMRPEIVTLTVADDEQAKVPQRNRRGGLCRRGRVVGDQFKVMLNN